MQFELSPVGVSDLDAIHRLYRRWETHWEIPEVTPASLIEDDLTAPHIDPDRDIRGVWDDDGLAAFGYVGHQQSGERLERAVVAGKVDPGRRGLGLGRRLLAWQIERAVEKLRECDPAIPWYVRTYEWEWVTDAHRLYSRFGLEPVRWFEDMLRPLALPLDAPLPDGVSIAEWSDVPIEETLRVSNESFADHWGSTPRDAESWNHLLSSPGTRPDLSYVAVADGDVVGVCLNGHFPDDREATGRLDGWIFHLGVVRGWRRRGVAAALIAASLEAFRKAGLSHGMIGVDADSPTGASTLYRNLGFEPLHRTVTSELRIGPAD